MDIVAKYVHEKKPEYDFVWIIFAINTAVAAVSFFVYGLKYTPVILCVVYSFVTSRVNDTILKGARSAAKFEIVTKDPEPLAQELMKTLRHGCTVTRGTGMYSQSDVSILICVVNRAQIADFEKILSKYKGAFVIVSSVNSTYGNFKKIK